MRALHRIVCNLASKVHRVFALRKRWAMFFTDELYQPLPGGTALKDPCTFHEGIVDYQQGKQVMLHRSPSIGRSALTDPSLFSNGKCKLVQSRVPQSPAEAQIVLQRARADVQRGTRWTLLNNCEDFVNFAYTGERGSSTRNFVFGVAAVFGFLALVTGSTR